MSATFNVFEILEMAEQIEGNGIKFYQKAAKSPHLKNMQKLILDLADMETEHKETFANMKNQLSEQNSRFTVVDPEGQAALYLHAMADGHVFNLEKDPDEQLKDCQNANDVLHLAIAAEKDSIAFYLGLKDYVPIKAGKDGVEEIIKEEMRHIAILNQKLKE